MAKIKQAPPSKGKAKSAIGSGHGSDTERISETDDRTGNPSESKGSVESERTQNGQSTDKSARSVKTIPLCHPENIGLHPTADIHVSRMSRLQRTNAKRLRIGLNSKDEVLANGKIVDGAGSTVRWLIEHLTPVDGYVLALVPVEMLDDAVG